MGRPRDIESHEEESSQCYQSWASLIIWCIISYCCMLVIFISVCFPDVSLLKLGLLPLFVQGSTPALFYAFSPHISGHFDKPKNLDIVALVPFHRPERTGILDCYLQRNLVYNHGLLDRVVFIPQTNDTASLEWLTSVVNQTSSYEISQANALQAQGKSKDTVFVWIDGDVVFFEDHTIPTIVKTKLDHPESLIVSANVVNQAVLESLHSHPSVALAYRPEISPGPALGQKQGWRASALPPWKGPANLKIHKGFSPPFPVHRWLPSGDDDFEFTPIGASVYSGDGPGFDHWTVSAQQHYSFLHHLERGDTYRYKFPMWTNPTKPISHNLFCFRDFDVADVHSFIQQNNSGERQSASQLPNGNNRHVIIDGKGLAAHYFTGQKFGGLEHTDVLHRYQEYAKELVCPLTA